MCCCRPEAVLVEQSRARELKGAVQRGAARPEPGRGASDCFRERQGLLPAVSAVRLGG